MTDYKDMMADTLDRAAADARQRLGEDGRYALVANQLFRHAEKVREGGQLVVLDERGEVL